MTETIAIVLAAGQGTRMKSAVPKVLHPIAGRSLVEWSLSAAFEAGVSRAVVVVGHGAERVREVVSARYGDKVTFAVQTEQRGTGHAVLTGLSVLDGFSGGILVLYGDCPLVTKETIASLLALREENAAPLAMLTMTLANPTGYGRILRNEGGAVTAIREHKDASDAERAIGEVNPGVYAIDCGFLRTAVASLTSDNAQGELYLTDIVERAARTSVVHTLAGDADELRGVNDRAELALCAGIRRRRIALAHARAGVGIECLENVFIDADVTLEPDAFIAAGVHLVGKTRVARGARIDAGSVLEDATVEEDAHVLPYSVVKQSVLGKKSEVGPFAHIRPDTVLGEGAKVGNFSETKKTRLGNRSKVNHLSYVGDGVIGDDVNVGAGTIFCNYDGVNKHTTTLEDGVFIGSDSQLVAPVRVGKGAYVASGTTVTKDVPADALAISRTKQDNKEGLAAKLRARNEALKAAKKKA